MSDRNVLVDLQQAVGSNDWANVDVYFKLLTAVAILGNEVYPQYTDKVTTNNSGEATAVLVTPATGAWQYQCTVGDVLTFIFNLEAGADIYLSAIVADNNLDASTNPGDIQAAIDAHVALADPHTQYQIEGEPITDVDYIDFNTAAAEPTHQAGRVHWNTTDETLEVGINDDVQLQFGRESHVRVRNNSGASIADGKLVKLTGSISDVMTISLAQADTVANARFIGFTTQTIANNGTGIVTIFGEVHDQDTSSASEGDTIYLSTAVAGEWVTVKPTYPDIAIEVGVIVRDNPTQGIIFAAAFETGAGAYEKAAAAQAAAEVASVPKNAAFVTAGATYTTLAANGASGLKCPVLSAITLADGMVPGYQFPVFRTGTGVVTIAAATTLVESVSGSGLVTLASVTLETTAVLLHLGSNVWLITGDYS